MNKITRRLLFELGKDLLGFTLVSVLMVIIIDSIFLPVIIGLLAYVSCLSTVVSLAKTMLEEFDEELAVYTKR